MDIKSFANKLFGEGKKFGFTDMEVYFVNSENFEVRAFQRDIDSYNVNTSMGLSFRGIINGKMGYAYTEKFEDEDIEFLLKNASQNAAEAQSDVEVSFFEGSKEYKSLSDREFKDVEAKRKIEDALKMEEEAFKADKRINSVQYCLLETSKGKRRIINTRGLDVEEETGVAVAYISVVAKKGEDVKNGRNFRVTSDYNKIDFSKMVDEAVKEAISRLGAQSLESGKYKVIFRYDAASNLLKTFSSIFSADSAQKGLSLLKGKVGHKIASNAVTIVDDPFYSGAPLNLSFDDEGVATFAKDIVKNGELKTLLHNLKTAKKEGTNLTGNGFKASYKSPVVVAPTNMYIEPGERSFEEAIKDHERAVVITELQGLHSGANAVSGDFSLAASGYLIENGKITMPVEQITVAGNFYDLLLDVEEVLNDLEFGMPSGMGNFGSPSIVVKEMNISGK